MKVPRQQPKSEKEERERLKTKRPGAAEEDLTGKHACASSALVTWAAAASAEIRRNGIAKALGALKDAGVTLPVLDGALVCFPYVFENSKGCRNRGKKCNRVHIDLEDEKQGWKKAMLEPLTAFLAHEKVKAVFAATDALETFCS